MSSATGQKVLAVLALLLLAAPAGLCTLVWLTPSLSTHTDRGGVHRHYLLVGHQDSQKLGGRRDTPSAFMRDAIVTGRVAS